MNAAPRVGCNHQIVFFFEQQTHTQMNTKISYDLNVIEKSCNAANITSSHEKNVCWKLFIHYYLKEMILHSIPLTLGRSTIINLLFRTTNYNIYKFSLINDIKLSCNIAVNE